MYDQEFQYSSANAHAAPSPSTPDGVYICTPAAMTNDAHLIANLSWVSFLRMMRGQEGMSSSPYG
jgi:hypothetical protein